LRFTVRRPASAEVSPCCHRPPGGDVSCSVHVSVAWPRVAGFALENRLALAVGGCNVPACRASLRRVCGRNLFNPATSLVLQTRGQKSPATTPDAAVQPPFLCGPHGGLFNSPAQRAAHRTHVKGFDTDGVEAPRDIGAGLFDPVLASVFLAGSQLRDRQLRARPPIRAALSAREPLLEGLQPLRLTRGEAWGAQQFAGRQYRRRRNTTVDTDHAPIVGASDRVGDVGKRHVPAASAITGDPVGLHTPWDRPRQPKAHPADLGHPHLTQPAIQIFNVMRFNADLPKPFMPSPSAPRRAAVRSSKKVAHRLGEVPQRLLLHGLRASRQPIVVGAGRGQLGALLGVARRATAWLPMLLLLNGQVPDKPGMTAMLVQHGSLRGARKQPVSRHARTMPPATRHRKERRRPHPA
jgi:hypothetical protein